PPKRRADLMDQDRPPNAQARSSIDALLDEQSACWREGKRTKIEDLLGRGPTSRQHPDDLLDLIVHEVSLRERAGESPDPEEYLGRFPWLADRLEVQLALQGLFRISGSATPGDVPAPKVVPPGAPAGYEIE